MDKPLQELATKTYYKLLIAANVWLLCSVLILGCGQTSAPGQVRNTEAVPNFGPIEKEVVVTKNSVDTNFLSNGSFACIVADVARLKRNEALADVPWQAISKQLAPLVGSSNADLEKVRRVWLVLDRGAIDSMMSAGSKDAESPLLFVVDYKDPFDLNDFDQAVKQRESNSRSNMDVEVAKDESAPSPGKQPAQLTARAINDKRVLIGSLGLVESTLESLGNRSELTDHVGQLKFENDIEGALTLGPVREIIAQMTSTLALFGNPELEKWKRLPNAIQSTTLLISLTGDDTITSTIEMDDEELVDAIIELAESRSGGPGIFPGLGSLGGVGLGRKDGPNRKSMITPTITAPLEVVANNVRDGNLFSVSKVKTNIHINLKRPDGLAEMLKALVVDSSKSFLLAERQRKLGLVLAALKKYESEHGCLPPEGIVASDDMGLPQQFNWRTGLLKYLDPELYAQFDFSKPWDDPENLKVAESIPDAFSMASENQGTPNATPKAPQTRFQVVGGERGFYGICLDQKKQPKVELMKDPKRYTAIVIETAEGGATPWTTPESVVLDSSKLGNENENGVLFISGDLKVRAIQREGEKIAAILSADGGEEVSRDDLISVEGK